MWGGVRGFAYAVYAGEDPVFRVLSASCEKADTGRRWSGKTRVLSGWDVPPTESLDTDMLWRDFGRAGM